MKIYDVNQLLSSEIKSKLIAHFWNCKCKNHDVTSLVSKMKTTQSNLSKHIAVLLKLDVLVVRQVGKERYYSINEKFKKQWFEIISPQVNTKENKSFQCDCSCKNCEKYS